MIIIGCDYHPGFQQIAYVNTDTGELSERRLGHREEAERFYHDLRTLGLTVRVGMEASGHARWFERLLGGLQFELWIGDAAAVRTKKGAKALRGGVRSSNHDRGCDRRDGWVGLSAGPVTIRSEPKVGLANLKQSEMALFSEHMRECAQN